MSGTRRGIISGGLIFAIFFLVMIVPVSAYGQVTLSGHVRDATGAGVCGATVSASTAEYFRTKTAADGSYSLSIPPGTYTVSMEYSIVGIPPPCPGQPTYPDQYSEEIITITSDTVKDYTFPPLYTVSGHVTDQNGIGIGGVTVGMGSSKSSLSAPDGSYSLQVFPGTYRVGLSKGNLKTLVDPIGIVVTSDMTKDFAFPSTVTLSGHVRDANGAGVCGALVYINNYQHSNFQDTATDGSYSLSVPPGNYIVSMYYIPGSLPLPCPGQPTYPPHYSEETMTITGDMVKDYTFPPLYTVSGHVTDQNGSGIGGVTVVMGSSKSSPSTPDGSYSLQVFPGTYDVWLYKGTAIVVGPKGIVVTGDMMQDFTFPSTVTLSGHVRDANGAGVCGAGIFIQNAQFYSSQQTATDGSYTLAAPPGTYEVSMSYGHSMFIPPYCWGQPTYPDQDSQETMTITGDTVKDYTFPPLYTVSGHVTDHNGAGIEGVTVSIGSSKSSPSAPDGSYSLQVFPGTYNVTLSKGNLTIVGATGLVVTSDMTRDFIFGPIQLIVALDGSGSGRVSITPPGIECTAFPCIQPMTSGTVVTLMAIPGSDDVFLGWSGCDTTTGSQCTVTMSTSRGVTATFAFLPAYQITVRKEGTGKGTVTGTPGDIACGDICSAIVDPCATVTLKAVPEPGYTFMGWSGGGCSGTGDCTVIVDESISVTARFDCVLPLPASQSIFMYNAVSQPVSQCSAAEMKPIGTGLAAAGIPVLNLAINMPAFSGPVDCYLAFYAPDLDRENIYLMMPDGEIEVYRGIPVPWKVNVSEPLFQRPWSEYGYLFGMPVPTGEYHVILLVTSSGIIPGSGPYYLWMTSFDCH